MATAAVLNGTITANGYGGSYYFEYATDAYYLANGSLRRQTAPAAYAGSASAATVSAQLTGLTPNTTYHYALVATNGVDTVTTGDQTFTTATTSLPPSISSPRRTNLADTTATLQATLDPSGQDTHYFFEYGTSTCAGGTRDADGRRRRGLARRDRQRERHRPAGEHDVRLLPGRDQRHQHDDEPAADVHDADAADGHHRRRVGQRASRRRRCPAP